MTITEAYALVPESAKWRCSFGYPGQGGFRDVYATADGEFWVSNGSWFDGGENDWFVTLRRPDGSETVLTVEI